VAEVFELGDQPSGVRFGPSKERTRNHTVTHDRGNATLITTTLMVG
jgi:hypothetical protein